MPSLILSTAVEVNSTRRPVAAIPRNSPSWLPVQRWCGDEIVRGEHQQDLVVELGEAVEEGGHGLPLPNPTPELVVVGEGAYIYLFRYTLSMDAATLLREARLAAGFSQAELAERSGTSQATLSDYERARKVPSAATLERILAATGRRLSSVPASRPVRSPGGARLARAGRALVEVLELAAELPTDHSGAELFPGLPSRGGLPAGARGR